jgi:hypothetical protein
MPKHRAKLQTLIDVSRVFTSTLYNRAELACGGPTESADDQCEACGVRSCMTHFISFGRGAAVARLLVEYNT